MAGTSDGLTVERLRQIDEDLQFCASDDPGLGQHAAELLGEVERLRAVVGELLTCIDGCFWESKYVCPNAEDVIQQAKDAIGKD